MSGVNWREIAEKLHDELEAACRSMAALDVYPVTFADDFKTAELVAYEAAGAHLIEIGEAEEVLNDLAETWRRRLLVAQIQDDRSAA